MFLNICLILLAITQPRAMMNERERKRKRRDREFNNSNMKNECVLMLGTS
jgi:hypothetical protein